jgi:DNA-binding IclR family transcriptional regulator
VLEFLAESKSGFSTSEISRRLGLPKSSTYLIVGTLERLGFLQKNSHSGRYFFGLKLISLSHSALENLDLREEAKPFLHSLMQETQLTVHMAVRERSEAVIIERISAPGMIRLATWVGRRFDVNCTAIGKALIAFASEEELDAVSRLKGFPRRNDNTITSLRALKRELARVRALGYSLEDEEDAIGLRCVGAPIFDATSECVAAISVSGTVSQVTNERIPALARLVKRTATQLSSRLGSISKNPRS